MSDQEWRAEAACRGADPNIWFPVRGEDTREAKEVCRDCPVQQACRDYALEVGEALGVWGGLSARERDGLRGRRLYGGTTGLPSRWTEPAAPGHGTEAAYKRHLRAGEPACAECKAAHSRNVSQWKSAKRRDARRTA